MTMPINKYEIDAYLLQSKMMNKSMSRADLAAATGLSNYTISAICTNNYNITINNIKAISKALELGQNDIFNIFFKRMWNVNYKELVDMERQKKEKRKEAKKVKVDPT